MKGAGAWLQGWGRRGVREGSQHGDLWRVQLPRAAQQKWGSLRWQPSLQGAAQASAGSEGMQHLLPALLSRVPLLCSPPPPAGTSA